MGGPGVLAAFDRLVLPALVEVAPPQKPVGRADGEGRYAPRGLLARPPRSVTGCSVTCRAFILRQRTGSDCA